jgi:HAD superfamily hydrolase (TIGR01549 family)
MNNIELFVFDLDGTLVSSHKTIFLATKLAFAELNYNYKLDEEKFQQLIGYHFNDIFKEFNITDINFDNFITAYRDYYEQILDTSTLFPNVEILLKYLSSKRKKIALLTTKRQDQAEYILEYFNLTKYFDVVCGKKENLPNKPNPTQLLQIVTSLKVNVSETVMIGDTEIDIRTGKNANTKTIAVTFGYRKLEKLKIENPDFLIHDLSDLIKMMEK